MIKELQAAVELSPAVREDVVLDRDTEGMTGHPPIAESIFDKITKCDVFVADLSFVGKTDEGRLIPNPNVLIEYGWALSQVGHARILLVMNGAFGAPSADTLPFDLRHYRWPKTYNAPPDVEVEVLRAERAKLQSSLRKDIAAILTDRQTAKEPAAEPLGVDDQSWRLKPTNVRSTFLNDGEQLCDLRTRWGDPIGPITWTNAPQSYLRVYPDAPGKEHTQFQLIEMIRSQHPLVLGRPSSLWWEQNEWGAVVFNADGQTKQTTAETVVQLTTHGEIWAIDQTSMWVRDGRKVVGYFEDMFLSRLRNYFEYCRDKLGVTSGVTVEVGFTGIRGYSVVLPQPPQGYWRVETIGGIASNDEIISTMRSVSLNADPLRVLHPFFVKAWGKFGLPRDDHLPAPI